MHDTANIPYFLGICTIPLITKFLIRLPIDITCTKTYESLYAKIPEINEKKFESLLTILQTRDKRNDVPKEVWSEYISCTIKQFQARFVNIFPTLIAGYLHLSAYLAIERMTFHETPIKDTMEILRNEYLSSTDPYMILPVINGIIFPFSTKISASILIFAFSVKITASIGVNNDFLCVLCNI